MRLMACTALGGTGAHYPFNRMGLFDEFEEVDHKVTNLRADDCLVVWGGSDIDPALYGKRAAKRTYAGAAARDHFEWKAMQQAIIMGLPIIGICRGAQMLCAAAGGYLIQHVENHSGGHHKVKTYDGQEHMVSSVHHQMMAPWGVEHELVAWADEKRSNIYIDVNEQGEEIKAEVPCDPEFVFFPKVKGFAIQWHPEFMSEGASATAYIKDYIKGKLNAATR